MKKLFTLLTLVAVTSLAMPLVAGDAAKADKAADKPAKKPAAKKSAEKSVEKKTEAAK